jgi:hypothetical protein
MNPVDQMIGRYRRLRYHERPLPVIGLATRACAPSWLIRCLAALFHAAAIWLAASRGVLPIGVPLVGIGVVVVWSLVRPWYAVSVLTIGMAAFLLWLSPGAVADLATVMIAVLAYLGWRLTMAAALLPWRGRAEWRTLLTWRDAVVAALSLVVAGAAFLPGSAHWVIVVIGIVGLLGLAAVFHLRRSGQ